jgi:hypothetical protein
MELKSFFLHPGEKVFRIISFDVGTVRIRVDEDLCVKKDVGIICSPAHKKLLHTGLVLKAGVAVFVNELLDTVKVTLYHGCHMNDVGHFDAQSSVLR